MKDDFYVGWSNEAPKSYRSKARLFFIVGLISIILVGVLYVKNERGFINSLYEYGELQEVSGYLVSQPVWGLRVEEDGLSTTIPLVGYGKRGPRQAISKMMKHHKLAEGTAITLRGMLFHYQGRKWMELTEMENSLVNVGDHVELKRTIKTLGIRTYRGEIVDPKCFFGVMNPADKAVHRSCAIRCIAGGIPPVLVIREHGKPKDYFFLVDSDRYNLQMKVLPYVGVPIEVSGREMRYDDWKVLRMDTGTLRIVGLTSHLNLSIARCN